MLTTCDKQIFYSQINDAAFRITNCCVKMLKYGYLYVIKSKNIKEDEMQSLKTKILIVSTGYNFRA